jgi:RNA polymerase sigma factor (sigma-70 family)
MARPRRQALSDEIHDLVERASDGDAPALERLLVSVQDDVHRLALRMTGSPDDALDATQEILIRVMTRLSTFKGEAAFSTWVHRVAVNHLLDRRRSAVERFELTFSAFADDLHAGLRPVARNAGPELDVLAREVKQGCTLALLTCLDRPRRVAYVLGEIFGVSSTDGAWICGTTEAAYRKRLSRARGAIREFVSEYCGLVAPTRARCHCRKRVPAAINLGRIDAQIADAPTPAVIDAAVAEMEALYDTAELLRSVSDETAPGSVTVRIRSLVRSGRYRVIGP